MVGTVTVQKLEDGVHNSVIKVSIAGDADLSAGIIYNASAYIGAITTNKLKKIQYTTSGLSAILYWDATTNVQLLSLPTDHSGEFDFSDVGGIINNAGTGITGDILITTSGLTAGDTAEIILWVQKKDVPITR